jgi:hypothetical protein
VPRAAEKVFGHGRNPKGYSDSAPAKRTLTRRDTIVYELLCDASASTAPSWMTVADITDAVGFDAAASLTKLRKATLVVLSSGKWRVRQ